MAQNDLFKRNFSRILLKWNRNENQRMMPWKGEKDPYKIWLSEIILQQTRVEQGLKYYEKFIRNFPSLRDLAKANEKKIFKLWEGLGYYTRCRNLIETARCLVKEHGSEFPKSYEDLLKLKGIGKYTAAAIASFAYNLPYAVLDANVYRVISRIFGIKDPVDSARGKAIFEKLSTELLDRRSPGIYNQAIMDFGAIICKPRNPNCDVCVFQTACKAFAKNKTQEFPVKKEKIKIKNRWFYYLILEYRGRVFIRKRTGKDIWNQLYEFYLIESPGKTNKNVILRIAEKNGVIEPGYQLVSVSGMQRQTLSHQQIKGQFFYLKLDKNPTGKGFLAVKPRLLSQFPFPKYIKGYLLNSPFSARKISVSQ